MDLQVIHEVLELVLLSLSNWFGLVIVRLFMIASYQKIGRNPRPVLEEWVLRGELQNVAAFKSWRQDGPGPTSVRCVEMPEEEALSTVCLECASPGGAAPAGGLAPSAIAGLAFGRVSQCMAHTAMGLGFCKSGQLSMAH